MPAAESALIVPTGEAADWTDISTVLAEVPERITCTRPLPDKRTIRFVWSTPPRAEDVDTVTRKRVPSPLVPAAYAEGCPDMSPDGKRLVFQGHTKDGRAFAFLSEHPDGRDAEAVVPTAEPTMSSEPTWLSDGQNFSFDVDSKHMGVFATKERRLTVLPEPMGGKALTSFRNVSGGLLFVSGFSPSEETNVIGLSWSPFREEMRFRFSVAAMDVTVGHGSKVYFTDPDGKRFRQVNELDRSTRIARRLGRVRGQIVRDLSVLADGLAFLSARVNADLFVVTADKGISRVTQDGSVFFGASCGNDFIVSRDDGRQLVIQRLDLTGRVLETRAAPGFAPGCSPDGSVFYYVMSASRAVVRCDRHGCGQLPSPMAMNLSVSPDGTRLAILSWAAHEPAVSWIASDGSGSNHFVSESETGCRPGWATAQTLWISRRREGKVVWVEVDADSGRETGKNVPGGRDCADGDDDPLSPVDRDVRIVFDRKSQLRLIAGDQMARN
ncbi:MAG TPA: hypothetical protein VN903_07285 [Polyangia bacterium]|nr:hypothetical protein [Polyangia bacterium]